MWVNGIISMQSANKVWVDFISSHSLGDTLAYMSMDVLSGHIADYPFYWITYMGRSNVEVTPLVEDNYIHQPLFQIYHKAGLYQNILTLNLPNLYEDKSKYDEYILRCLKVTYNELYNEVVWQRPKFELSSSAMWIPNLLRNMFQFLDRSTEPYSTVHFCSSTNHCSMAYDFLPDTKRMSFDKLIQHLPTITKRAHTVKFIGNRGDKQTTEACVAKLKTVMPYIKTSIHCDGSLEDTLRILYNSKAHLATESFSSFFTSQLGIPSIQVCLHPNIYGNDILHDARTNLQNHYRYIESLTFDTDSVLVWNTDNKDLR
jgi:hypothetical protein